jgi:hypothetical protein
MTIPEAQRLALARELLAAEYRRRNIKSAEWIELYPEHGTPEVMAALAALAAALSLPEAQRGQEEIDKLTAAWVRCQAIADRHADILSPRDIDALYAAAAVVHDAINPPGTASGGGEKA